MRGPENKSDFYRRFYSGEFGNVTFTTDCLEDVEDRKEKLWALRSKVPGGPCLYNLTKRELRKKHKELKTKWNLNISAMADSERLIFQGEVCRNSSGLFVAYSCLKLPMRQALSMETRFAHGLKARFLLLSGLCANSFDWLMQLLEYENTLGCSSVVEFSTYDCPMGTDLGFNTVFWEVRNY